MMSGERIVIGVGALVAVLLQLFLAPHIAIGQAVPNVLATLCLAVAVARPDLADPVLPFALGLAYDLMSGGPVGAMAFTLTAATTFSAWLFTRANNDTRFMAVAVLVAGVLSCEVVYGMFYLLFGYAAGAFEAFAYRIVPCFVYDAVIALVLYLLAARFLKREAPLQSEIKQLH